MSGNYFELSSAECFIGENTRIIRIPTDPSIGTLSEVKIEEFAGSFSCRVEQHQIPAIRNRFIIWRCLGSRLILEEHSFDLNLTENSIELQFPNSAVLPGVGIHGSSDNLFVLVPTVTSVHRFPLPHPREAAREKRKSRDSQMVSILGQFPEESTLVDNHNRFLLNGSNGAPQTAATTLNGQLEAVFALGYYDGSILIVTLPSYMQRKGTAPTQELIRPTSMIRRILSPFSQSNESTAVEMLFHNDSKTETFLYSLTKECRLKIWSLKSKDYVCNFDLSNWFLTDGQKSVIRTDDKVSLRKCVLRDMLFLIVYLIVDERGIFLVLGPTDLRTNVAKVADLETPENLELVDFCLSTNHIWTLWRDSQGRISVKIVGISLDSVEQSEWEEVELNENVPSIETLIHSIPSDKDLNEYFADQLLMSGRFSYETVVKALKVCTKSFDQNQLTSWKQLREKLISLSNGKPDRHMSLNESMMSDDLNFKFVDPRRKKELKFWKKLWSACVQYHQVGSKPLSLLSCSQMELFGLIRTERFTTFLPFDNKLKSLILPDHDIHCSSLIGLKTVADKVSDDVLINLFSSDPCELFQNLIKTFAQQSNKDMIDLDELWTYAEAVSETLEPSTGDMPMLIENNTALEPDFVHFARSHLSSGLLSCALERCVVDRATLCIRLVSMIAYAIGTANEERRDVQRRFESLAIRALQLAKCYKLVARMCHLQMEISNTNMLESSVGRLSVSDDVINHIPASVLSSLLSSPRMANFIRQVFGDKFDLEATDWPLVWGIGAPTLISTLLALIWPNCHLLIVPDYLLEMEQYGQLKEYCQSLSPWHEETSNVMAYYYAVALANLGDSETAFSYFTQAVEGLKQQDLVLLAKIFPSFRPAESPAESEYFLKVVAVYERLNQIEFVIRTVRLGLNYCEINDSNVPTLWTILFKHELELGHYAESLSAVRSNPDGESKRNCLRQLLLALVEQDQINLLCSLDYGNIESQVVDILEARARSIDLMKPPDYYHLLYSFHITRDNFRKAAISMYELSIRLSQETSGLAALRRRCQALATCYQTLQLVKKENAWIVKPSAKKSINPESGRSPKRDADGEPVTSSISLEIMLPSQIRQEYLIAEARFYLSNLLRNQLNFAPPRTPTQLIQTLLQHDSYDKATCLCQAFEMDLSTVLDSLTVKCVRSEVENGAKFKWLEENKMLFERETTASGNGSEQCWRLLQLYLEKFSNRDTGSKLYRTVTTRLLSLSRSIPVWLGDRYKKIDISDFVRVLIEYDQLNEASLLIIDYVDAVLGKTDTEAFDIQTPLRPGAPPVWLPYTAIDWLMEILAKQKSPLLLEVSRELEAKMNEYLTQLDIVTTSSQLNQVR